MIILEQLDREWVELMKSAKQQGLTKKQISQYIKNAALRRNDTHS